MQVDLFSGVLSARRDLANAGALHVHHRRGAQRLRHRRRFPWEGPKALGEPGRAERGHFVGVVRFSDVPRVSDSVYGLRFILVKYLVFQLHCSG